MTHRQRQFVASLLNLTYGELMEICTSLADMNDDKEARPQLETAADFASLLHDWADAAE